MRVSALPQAGPGEVFVGGEAVFVDVVFVADVEGGIGEGEVDGVFQEGVSCRRYRPNDCCRKRLRSRGMVTPTMVCTKETKTRKGGFGDVR